MLPMMRSQTGDKIDRRREKGVRAGDGKGKKQGEKDGQGLFAVRSDWSHQGGQREKKAG